MKAKILSLLIISFCVVSSMSVKSQTYEGNVVASEGAWCWFADPRALHYENEGGTINSTYIGYIDVHGNIKATQHDFLTGRTNEVLIRSYFQPDDHDNPTFLVLPDERVMIFYSRHTDEACFYYRISREPGDITTLGREVRLATANNTTYPSPFILSNDPNHIYLCWRGINWHPTIARLTIPDADDNASFDWGPKQIVQSTGARPYAKYMSNGKDKIYLTYTTGHPDNENPNWVYFNYINIPGTDATKITLTDVEGKTLSTINSGVHNVNKTTYSTANPKAVVDNTAYRDWVWQVSMDAEGKPVIAMVKINDAKTSHDYYHATWTGSEWKKTFLSNGGGHFHQTSGLELCYSGGMAIDDKDASNIYCSVPVTGTNGKVYEIIKYTVVNGTVTATEQITKNSKKNNIRPYIITNSGNSSLRLTWMHGDYYDWIVSVTRPKGYPTAIHCDFELPSDPVDLNNGLVKNEDFTGTVEGSAYTDKGVLVSTKNTSGILPAESSSAFSVSTSVYIYEGDYNGNVLKIGDMISWGLDRSTIKPYVKIGDVLYNSTNLLGNSDIWQTASRGTGGNWPTATKLKFFNLTLTYDNGLLRTYINGLIDQSIVVEGLNLDDVAIGGFTGWVEDCRIYNRALLQGEVKELTKISLAYTENSDFLNGIELEMLEVPSTVYTDVVMPAQTSSGKTITWKSSSSSVVSTAGIVTFPNEPTTVTLTATINGQSKDFTVTVMPRDIKNNKLLAYTFESADLYSKSGAKYVSDHSGKGNDAVVYGSAVVDGTLDLTANTAAGFSTNGYATAPNGIIDALRSYSFLMKVTPSGLDKLPRLYDFGSASSNSVFGRADALTAGLKYNGGTTKMITSTQKLTIGKETRLAFTYDAKTKATKIYIDGVVSASGTDVANEPYQLSQIGANTRNYIGRAQWWDTSESANNIDFKGTIDDFYLFDIALTADEITQIQTKNVSLEINKLPALTLYPNPVNRNEKIELNYGFTPEGTNGLKVEVINMLGKTLQTILSNQTPVTLDGFTQSGLYIVRVTDGNKNVMTGKILVK